MRKAGAVLVALLCLPSAACLNIEETLTFEKNLSGTAAFVMNVNLEPMSDFIVMMKQVVESKPGPPSAADLEAGRKELLAEATKSPFDAEKEKADLAKALPEGVRLLDASFKQEGLKLAANFRLAFDHPSKLDGIKLSQNPNPASPIENPVESPFGGLKVVDEGATILVTSPLQDLVNDKDKAFDDKDADPALKAMFESMLKGLKLVYKVNAPFEVVEHNATRKDGTTLVWEYDLSTFEKLKKLESIDGIRVRFRK